MPLVKVSSRKPACFEAFGDPFGYLGRAWVRKCILLKWLARGKEPQALSCFRGPYPGHVLVLHAVCVLFAISWSKPLRGPEGFRPPPQFCPESNGFRRLAVGARLRLVACLQSCICPARWPDVELLG